MNDIDYLLNIDRAPHWVFGCFDPWYGDREPGDWCVSVDFAYHAPNYGVVSLSGLTIIFGTCGFMFGRARTKRYEDE